MISIRVVSGLTLQGQFFEGDISGVQLKAVDVKSDFDGQLKFGKNAIKNTYKLWPNGLVPYVISSKYSATERGVINSAIAEMGRISCVKWKPRTFEKDYVHILKDQGCYSRVGRTGGAQVLSLGRGCVYKGTVLPEMLHASGFWHEQSRPDRDQHVQIVWSNIMTGREDNFARYSRSEVSTLSLPYDIESVLHYSATAFSRNGQYTIRPWKTSYVSKLGQRRGMTRYDIQKLNTLYKCRQTPVITTAPTTTTTPRPTTACRDKYSTCQTLWSKNSGCTKYEAFMRDHCPKTCNFCQSEIAVVVNNLCKDLDSRCPGWVSYNQGQCSSSFLIKTCKKSCQICKSHLQYDGATAMDLDYLAVIVDSLNEHKNSGSPSSHSSSMVSQLLQSTLTIVIILDIIGKFLLSTNPARI